jgi:hypothetical protein
MLLLQLLQLLLALLMMGLVLPVALADRTFDLRRTRGYA